MGRCLDGSIFIYVSEQVCFFCCDSLNVPLSVFVVKSLFKLTIIYIGIKDYPKNFKMMRWRRRYADIIFIGQVWVVEFFFDWYGTCACPSVFSWFLWYMWYDIKLTFLEPLGLNGSMRHTARCRISVFLICKCALALCLCWCKDDWCNVSM